MPAPARSGGEEKEAGQSRRRAHGTEVSPESGAPWSDHVGLVTESVTELRVLLTDRNTAAKTETQQRQPQSLETMDSLFRMLEGKMGLLW